MDKGDSVVKDNFKEYVYIDNLKIEDKSLFVVVQLCVGGFGCQVMGEGQLVIICCQVYQSGYGCYEGCFGFVGFCQIVGQFKVEQKFKMVYQCLEYIGDKFFYQVEFVVFIYLQLVGCYVEQGD